MSESNPLSNFAGTLARPDGSNARPVRGLRCRSAAESEGGPQWEGSIAARDFDGLGDLLAPGGFLLDFGFGKYPITIKSLFDDRAWFVTGDRIVENPAPPARWSRRR